MIDFSDLFLPEENPMLGHIFPGPKSVPEEMRGFVTALIEKAKQSKKVDFSVDVDNVFFRCSRMPTITGNLYIFRRMPSEVWPLSKCGLPKHVVDFSLSERLCKGGLIVVSGMPGNGKSTTCASMIIERLKEFGGLCITVEDPPEMPMQGQHGNGLCFQREVNGGEDFHVAVRDAMRGYPSRVNTMMLIGEVRDAQTASLALRSAVDGRLVFITTHAGNVIQATQRIISLASGAMSTEEARELLASGIRMIIHQKIENGRLDVSSIIDTQGVVGVIRSKTTQLESLNNELIQQKNLIKVKGRIDTRE
jgi:twitching motility protein PilT